jgi:hypothetical protein
MQIQLLICDSCVPFAGKRQALHYRGRVLGKVDRPTVLWKPLKRHRGLWKLLLIEFVTCYSIPCLDSWHTTHLWLDGWHTTQFYCWTTGTPHSSITGRLAHHTVLLLDGWHTTYFYYWTTGTPHNSVTGWLAHHTVLWLDDWHNMQLCGWRIGTPRRLDDWHTPKLYDWTNGTPHSSVAGGLAHPTTLSLDDSNHTALCLGDWHTTQLWLDEWHTTHICDWRTGTRQNSMNWWLAHDTSRCLDDWHTTQLYGWMTGTPHSSLRGWLEQHTTLTGRLAHRTALWLEDWLATIALWLDAWQPTKVTRWLIWHPVLHINDRHITRLLLWMTDTRRASTIFPWGGGGGLTLSLYTIYVPF